MEQQHGSAEPRFCQAIHFLTMAAGDADTNAAVAGALHVP